MFYILNFNNSRNLEDIKYAFDHGKQTNLDILLEDFSTGATNWSVLKKTLPGDEVVFMCANSARDNLGLATSHIPASYSHEFRDFVDEQKALYKKYSGYLLGYGIVASAPEYDQIDKWWRADIHHLKQFPNPIPFNDFKSFITVSPAGSVTPLKEDKWERLKWTINLKNPSIFPDAIAPDAKTLANEFETATQKEQAKPLERLKKEAQKKASKPEAATVQTKVYQRNPSIAAYVKKKANGYCQLCGQKAPFKDQNGEPYLECHHIEWLSKGGSDSIDNCVALCPNCHRKMHVVNDIADISILKAAAG